MQIALGADRQHSTTFLRCEDSSNLSLPTDTVQFVKQCDFIPAQVLLPEDSQSNFRLRSYFHIILNSFTLTPNCQNISQCWIFSFPSSSSSENRFVFPIKVSCLTGKGITYFNAPTFPFLGCFTQSQSWSSPPIIAFALVFFTPEENLLTPVGPDSDKQILQFWEILTSSRR